MPNELLTKALLYASRGWAVFPCHSTDAQGHCSCGKPNCSSPGKHPRTKNGLNDATADEATIRSWWARYPDANLGIAMGASGLVGLDIDVKNGVAGDESWHSLVAELGCTIDDTTIVETPSGGAHRWYHKNGSRVGCDAAGKLLGRGIDVKGEGGYLLAPPSSIAGREYTFVAGHGLDRLNALPSSLAERLTFIKPRGNGDGRQKRLVAKPVDMLGRPLRRADPLPETIREGTRNVTLMSAAGTMQHRGMSREAIEAALLEENAARCGSPLPEDEVRRIAASVAKYEPGAGRHALSDLHRSDTSNAELFADLNADEVRFDHRRGDWFVWGEHHWVQDDDGEIIRLGIEAVRLRYSYAVEIENLADREEEAKFAISSENRQRIEAMLALARSLRPLATSGDRWNRDPMFLAVSNGVIDLHDGSLRDGRPEDMINWHTDVAYEPTSPCSRWLRFLDQIFLGDRELIDWIWRVVGYLLTGLTREQCFFLCHGIGSNGKSVLLNVLRALLGHYSFNVPFTTFEMSARTQIPNDLAAMVDRRLVTSSETNEGVLLNEARVKMLTGGDPVTARFLHHEFFTFVPVAKFVLAVNHKPRVKDYSYGFWRRVRLVPFDATFEGAAADQHLEEQLLEELPGILAWAVAGCLEWQERGLQAPEAVKTATAGYRSDSDPLAEFIAARCIADKTSSVKAAAAHDAYNSWAQEQGLAEPERLGRNRFFEVLESHFPKKRTNAAILYVGLRLHDPERPTLDDQ